MRVIRNRPENRIDAGPTGRRSVIAIGNFDGVHRGHLALVDRCRHIAVAGEQVVVLTFEPLPQAFFRPQQAPARLSTVYQKLSLLRAAGADLVWLMRFGRELAGMGAREFVQQALVQGLAGRCIVIGEDFRFGSGRVGNATMLREFGEEMGFSVETVAAVQYSDHRISSSGIRHLLAASEFSAAEKLLGRPFTMEGHVVRGAKLGRQLGFPTANLRIRAHPTPVQGVFAVFARAGGGRWLPAVSNLGWRPVVNGREPLLEVHVFDFNEDLYGQRLEVQFVAKLRDELNFGTLDDLVVQMKQDAADARLCLAQAIMPD